MLYLNLTRIEELGEKIYFLQLREQTKQLNTQDNCSNIC